MPNPILPLHEYIPDGEPHVFGDRVYLYGSHDKEAGESFCMLDYVIWSAPVDDLGNWSNKGVNYSAKQDPLYGEGREYMYAPDCVQGNDGRYYLYYCLAGYKGRGGYANPISVAVCDTPDGKYTYLGYVREKDGTPFTRLVCFDPGVMNDDGVIRLYFGADYPFMDQVPIKWIRYKILSAIMSKSTEEIKKGILGSYHVTLADDMMTITGEPVRIDNTIQGSEYRDHMFFEASSMRKVGKTYYFVYSSVNNHELCYAVSDRPDGGFVYGGTIVSNGDVGYQGRTAKDRLNHTGTNHGSIEKIGENWYVFYHRLTHNSDYSRQACAEPITIAPDGTIPQVEITSSGLNNAPLTCGIYPAGIYCNLSNGHMSHGSNSNKKVKDPCFTSSGEERYITGITNGTLIGYKYFALEGSVRLTLTVRGGSGTFKTNLGAEIPMEASQNWQQISTVFTVEKGTYPLLLTYCGKGRVELKEFSIQKEAAK